MAEICPDNSTQCLLRGILDGQSTPPPFNWDPLSFAFTAAIGLLALIVAGTTVFQGLLAAGPGRLKASKAALGSYAKTTKTKFDWHEMRYRTTARVPFLPDLLSLSPVDYVAQGNDIQSFPARWVSMLEAAAVTISGKGGGFLGDQGIRESIEVVTDHLPVDVAAAPAWCTAQSAVIMACMAGCNVVTMVTDSPYPIVRGPYSQLRFREHPDLGTVAVFDLLVKRRLRRPGDNSSNSSSHNSKLMMKQSILGPICYNPPYSWSSHSFAPGLNLKNVLEDFSGRCNNCTHTKCKQLLNTPLAKTSIHGLQNILVPIVCSTLDYPRTADLAPRPNSVLAVLHKLRKQCIAFPHDSTFNSLQDNTIHRSEGGQFLFDDQGPGITRQPSKTRPKLFNDQRPELSWLYSDEMTYRYPRPDLAYSATAHEEKLRILGMLLPLLNAVVQGHKLDASAINTDRVRKGLDWQLREVDWWLLHQGGPLAACECISLACDTVDANEYEAPISEAPPRTIDVLPHLEVAALDAPSPIDLSLPTLLDVTEIGQEAVVESEDIIQRREYLRKVLLFRAAVYTVYLHTAADISCVLDNELGRRIVQLL